MIPEGLSRDRVIRLNFWIRWLDPKSPFSANRIERMTPGRELPGWAKAALPDGVESPRILDISAGPVTSLGTLANGKEVELIPIDDLAYTFNRLIAEQGYTPPVPTRFCSADDVRVTFGESYFHLIYSYNGLDYTPDPIRTYRELLTCLAPGGKIITFHDTADNPKQIHRDAYRHFHVIRDTRLVILNKSYARVLQDALPEAEIHFSREGNLIRLEMARAATPQWTIRKPRPVVTERGLPALVSMHLPKTAGSSFRVFLENLYGESLRCLYRIDETATDVVGSLKLDPKIRCLHGHFQANAFEKQLPGAAKITWLRHPVERVVSSYFEYQRSPESYAESAFNRKVFEEGWGLMEFARHTSTQRQVRWYFNAVPLADFLFIGITEHYDESLWLLCYLLGIDPRRESTNVRVNPKKVINSQYALPEFHRKELEGLYSEEMELYRTAKFRLQSQLRMAFGDQAPDLE